MDTDSPSVYTTRSCWRMRPQSFPWIYSLVKQMFCILDAFELKKHRFLPGISYLSFHMFHKFGSLKPCRLELVILQALFLRESSPTLCGVAQGLTNPWICGPRSSGTAPHPRVVESSPFQPPWRGYAHTNRPAEWVDLVASHDISQRSDQRPPSPDEMTPIFFVTAEFLYYLKHRGCIRVVSHEVGS